MELAELLIIAIGVSMDAFAVSICKGLSMAKMSWKKAGIIGMYFGYNILGINEWLLKVFFTIVVLIYNYITRKIFIFKPEASQTTEAQGNKNVTEQ